MLLLLLGAVSYLFIILLVFSSISAGRRADEGEERILKIISATSSSDIAENDERIEQNSLPDGIFAGK
jgi:hypothetical protein